ncbi:MAG: NfeD family protein [Methanomassiliicoccales archaeon]|nr:NfeD family protein [Methanomassiliicoccales archaeon]NYT15595.1 NfeD family protein [Methanomassiliicoccales archaeon]
MLVITMDLTQILALAFIVIGVILLIAEAASPGTFLIVPGTVLLILGAIGLIEPDLLTSWWAPVVVAIILIPLTLLTIKGYQRLAPTAPPETTVASSLLGKQGLVTREIEPDSLKGKVMIENDTWSATAETVIQVGKRVVVKSSEGVHVKVEELGD